MTKDEFWALIARCRADDADETARAVEDTLTDMPPAEICSFQGHLQDRMAESYDWRLWGAAYLARGGCSDDSFDYFREWLITQGQATFERILQDPDSLADLEADVSETEELLSVAWNAYRRTQKQDMPAVQGELQQPGEPHGSEWEEDDLPRLFPKIAARYG